MVAIKTIAAFGWHEQKRQFRFEAEGRLLARQRHPNIVQVYETGEEHGQPYFVMEFVDGPSLSQKLGGRPLKPREAAELLEALARAVAHAHQGNIIHSDLKPANVLLARRTGVPACPDVEGSRGRLSNDFDPKIADFGLAKLLLGGEALTQTEAIMGTGTTSPLGRTSVTCFSSWANPAASPSCSATLISSFSNVSRSGAIRKASDKLAHAPGRSLNSTS